MYAKWKAISLIPDSICFMGGGGHLPGVMAKVFDCDNTVNEFDLQLRYYVHFWTTALWKGMNSRISPAMG